MTPPMLARSAAIYISHVKCRMALPALLAVIAVLVMATAAAAQDAPHDDPEWKPAPPSDLEVVDNPNDAGRALIVRWSLSPDDSLEFDPPRIAGYRLYRAEAGDDPEFVVVKTPEDIPPTVTEITDEGRSLKPRTPYLYRLVAVSHNGVVSDAVELDEPVASEVSLFDRNRSWFLVLTLLVSFWIIYFIYLARSGIDLKIRKIAGLEAVDEAVGRATEMGRPILFVPGIQDMNNIQTVAGITVLSRIGKMAAEYDARIEVPTSRSLVMTTARETLESSYLAAGRPDAYHDDMSYYVTDEQFGYVAYLAGYMSREEPAACFYLGAFFAESLILAETGNSIGAIQVAGTAEPAQLPFFVAACDYTLIGEEFFAASAYLSGEPEQLATLKGQDVGKVIGGSLIVIGCLVATYAQVFDSDAAQRAVNYLMFEMLGTEDVPEEVIEADIGAEDGEQEQDVAAIDGAFRFDDMTYTLEMGTVDWEMQAPFELNSAGSTTA